MFKIFDVQFGFFFVKCSKFAIVQFFFFLLNVQNLQCPNFFTKLIDQINDNNKKYQLIDHNGLRLKSIRLVATNSIDIKQ